MKFNNVLSGSFSNDNDNEIGLSEIVDVGEMESLTSGSRGWRRELLNETVQNARLENYNTMLGKWKNLICNPEKMKGMYFRLKGKISSDDFSLESDSDDDDLINVEACEGFDTYIFTGCNKSGNIIYLSHASDKTKRTSFSFVDVFELFTKGKLYPVNRSLCFDLSRLIIQYSTEKKYEGSEWNWVYAKSIEEMLLSSSENNDESFVLPSPSEDLLSKYSSILKEKAAASPDSRKNRQKRAEQRREMEIARMESEKIRTKKRQLFFFERDLLKSLPVAQGQI